MQHSFDVDIAKEYGLKEAILLNHLYFWIEKNKANEVHYYDGTYWTYNSVKAFNKLFPYLSERQINNTLKALKDKGIIQTGNYNKSAYDRTMWYAFTKTGVSIMQKCKMEDTKMSNGDVKNVKPIPDINTDINADINISAQPKSEKSSDLSPYDFLITQYLVLYAELYRDGSVKTEKPCYNEKQIRKQINELLKSYTVYDLYTVLTNAKNDKWLISTGFSISLIFAASQVQRLLNSTAPQYPQERQKKEVYTDADYLAGASDLDNTPF